MTIDAAAQRVWEAALGRLQIQMPRPSYDTWLRGTAGASLTDQTLFVNVRSTFAAEWLEQRMQGLIEAAASAVARRPLKIAFQVATLDASPLSLARPSEEASVADAPRPSSSRDDAQFNGGYTFESFVIGQSNRLAYAAAMAVADAPGRAYNPLFVYGPVGVGKTHLLHAIGLRTQLQGYTATYVTAEQFTNEFLAALRLRKMDAFRERYRSTDILLIDDIQFFAGKEGTQEGFFHTFNALHMAGRQVVLAADRPPATLTLIEERLRSRFESGLATDVGAPDYETRVGILQRIAETAPIAVQQDTVELVASQAPGNVRQLVGYFNRITALAQFTNTVATPDVAMSVLPATSTPTQRPTPATIVGAVSAVCGVPTAAILGKRRDRPVSEARQLCMLLLHEILQLSPTEIGQVLGNRHRATIMHGIREVTKRLPGDAALSETFQQAHLAIHAHASVPTTGISVST